jgi:hypothetical protein
MEGSGGDRRRPQIAWPTKLLGPPPGLKELTLACWGALAAFLIVRVAVPAWIGFRTGADTLHILPADFIYFYGIGRIAHEYPLARVYDYTLQLKVFNQVYPLHDGAYGPSPYPPFVALFFSLFARLPFIGAFALWMAVSLALYLIGIGAAVKGVFAGEPLKTSLAFCLSIGFYPFLIGTLINGQLAAIAVCAVGLSVAAERSGRQVRSGFALALLAYKPTLLPLLLPMLLLTRRFRALGGFVAGLGALFCVATAFGGFAIWADYAHFLSLFGRVASFSDRSGLPLWKYVDLGSCLQALAGGASKTATMIAFAVTGAIAVVLCVLWLKSAKVSRGAQPLVWATALTWTLLINIYVPVYDSVLAAASVLLTLAALESLGWSRAVRWMVFVAAFTLAASWFTSAIAIAYRVQLLSIALAVLGTLQIHLLQRAIRNGKAEETDAKDVDNGEPKSEFRVT